MILAERAALGEPELIRRAQAGDSAAFSELVRRYMRRAYYAALGLVGCHDDALDLSQEAFVRAYEARHRIDPELPFFTWLYQILRRLCFNFVRDRGLRRRKLEGAAEWLAQEASQRIDEPDPQRGAELSELRQRLRRGIEALPDREREVLVLKEFEGLRYREIAELVGIPIGTVMSRLYTARRNLARAMEDGS